MAEGPILDRLPTPLEIHREMGAKLRELAILRRLLKLAQAAAEEKKPTGHEKGK